MLGARVCSKFSVNGHPKWFMGTITEAARAECKWEVCYDDGEVKPIATVATVKKALTAANERAAKEDRAAEWPSPVVFAPRFGLSMASCSPDGSCLYHSAYCLLPLDRAAPSSSPLFLRHANGNRRRPRIDSGDAHTYARLAALGHSRY